jgi:hypothetical protein
VILYPLGVGLGAYLWQAYGTYLCNKKYKKHQCKSLRTITMILSGAKWIFIEITFCFKKYHCCTNRDQKSSCVLLGLPNVSTHSLLVSIAKSMKHL